MDACDAIMDSIAKPKGLIRYASTVSIEEGHSKIFTNRVKFYTLVLTVLIGVFITLFANRSSIEIKVFRDRNNVLTVMPDGTVRNNYNATIINKSSHVYKNLEVKLIGMDANIIVSTDEDQLNLKKEEVKQVGIVVEIPKEKIKGKKIVVFGIYDKGKLVDKFETKFIAPIN
jgi:polyferredoxin